MTESSIWWTGFFICAAIVSCSWHYWCYRELQLKAAHKAKMLEAQAEGFKALCARNGAIDIKTSYWENW